MSTAGRGPRGRQHPTGRQESISHLLHSLHADICILRAAKRASHTFEIGCLRTATRAAPCSGYLRTYTSYSVTSISTKKQTTTERSIRGKMSSPPEMARRLLLLFIIQTSATCRARPSWPSASYGQTRNSLTTATFVSYGQTRNPLAPSTFAACGRPQGPHPAVDI